jgi:hypothetical protein
MGLAMTEEAEKPLVQILARGIMEPALQRERILPVQ